MPKLMPYLIINYPNPEEFEVCLRELFNHNPAFLEIQLPFSNPVADGPTIWDADQEALKYDQEIEKSLKKIQEIKSEFKECTTELILMSYVSRVSWFGVENIANLLIKYSYYGLVSPDIAFGSSEQKTLSKIWENQKPSLIPVIAPNTSENRINQIKSELKPGQMVYPTARIGITGQATDFSDPNIIDYFQKLKDIWRGYQVSVGFGIKSYSQIKILEDFGFVSIVATAIIKEINLAKSENRDIGKSLTSFLKQLSGEDYEIQSKSV